jgi:hypothetical protein
MQLSYSLKAPGFLVSETLEPPFKVETRFKVLFQIRHLVPLHGGSLVSPRGSLVDRQNGGLSRVSRENSMRSATDTLDSRNLGGMSLHDTSVGGGAQVSAHASAHVSAR